MNTVKTTLMLGLVACGLVACKSSDDEIVADKPAGTNPTSLDASSLDALPSEAMADAELKSCPTDLPGPALVEVATPDGTRYCIDKTEVTQRDYFEFLDAVSKTGDWTELGFDDARIYRSGNCDRIRSCRVVGSSWRRWPSGGSYDAGRFTE